MTRQPDWDHDFRRGNQGELFVLEIVQRLTNGTVETKRDDRAMETGNLYIETECYRIAFGEYLPSGLSESKAELWAFVVGPGLLVVPAGILRAIESRCRRAACSEGSNPTRGFLAPLSMILNELRRAGIGVAA